MRALLPLLLWLAAITPGCAFEAGAPWGEVALTLTAVHEVPAGRLDGEGRLITAADFAIRVDRLELRIDAVALRFSGGASGPSAFDPANPPPGYTLCHNGHCHSDAGGLVDYADIEAELAGAGAAGGATLARLPVSPLTAIGREVTTVPLGACPEGADGDHCFVDAGAMQVAQLSLTEVRVTGRVFDRRTGEARRLPEEGLSVTEALAVSEALQAPAFADFGRDRPIGATVALSLVLDAALFDGIDWSQPLTGQVREAFATRIADHLGLTAAVGRYDQ